MFANEYQGGTHVEVLSTQGQNPLAQWKVVGPQKGLQKVFDKAVKGNVFASSGVCRLALPRDERGSLGLTQPHLLLQLAIGVGVPFSLEVGLTDSTCTRRRVILSASFSELKCTPLHCQVPFTSLPRDVWLNLVLPLPELAVALFRSSPGSNSGGTAPGGAAGGAGGTAAGGGGSTAGGTAGSAAAGAGASSWYRSLDCLQLAGSCRLRRICTLRDPPQLPPDEAGVPFNQPCLPKSLDFPAGVDFQTLQLDPRSLTFVPLGYGYGSGTGPGSSAGGAGAAGGAALGVVGTSTGSTRRQAAGSAGVTPPVGGGVGVTSLTLTAAANGRGTPLGNGRTGAIGGNGGGGGVSGGMDEDGAVISPTRHVDGMGGLRATGMPYLAGGGCDVAAAGLTHGSPTGQSTPTARGSGNGTGNGGGGGGVGYVGHYGSGGAAGGHLGSAGEHVVPSRLGRFAAAYGTGGGSSSPNGGPSTTAAAAGFLPLPGFGAPGAPAVHGPPTTGPSSGLPPSGRLPPVNGAVAMPSGNADNGNRSGSGDNSPFGGRRALSAQTIVRYGQTVDGAVGGTADGAGGVAAAAAVLAGGGGMGAVAGGVGGGVGFRTLWPRSVIGKRAQSGPARISTEALTQAATQPPRKGPPDWSYGAEGPLKGLGDTVAPPDTPTSPSLAPRHVRRVHNTSNLPPTIIEHEAMPPTHTAMGSTPAGSTARSPNRSPSRLRHHPITGGGGGAAAAAARAGGEPATPSLPLLRVTRADVAPSREPSSPATAAATGGSSSPPFTQQLSSVLTVRGGLDASLDFASQQQLMEGSCCSPSILSSLTRGGSNPLMHTHRYGGSAAGGGGGGGAVTAAATVPGTSGDLWLDSDDDAAVGCGGGMSSTATVSEPLPAKVGKVRTRVPGGGGSSSGAAGKGGGGGAGGGGGNTANGGGGGGWGAAAGTAGATAAASAAGRRVPLSAALTQDADTPTRATRAAAAAAGAAGPATNPAVAAIAAAASAGQNGRSSPAGTPSRTATRLTPPHGSNAAPGSSPFAPGRQRGREESNSGAARPAAAAAAAAAAGGTCGKPPTGAASPARQRAAATPPRGAAASRIPPRPGLPYAEGRERLPPLAGGSGTAGGRGGGGAAAATAGGGGGAGRGKGGPSKRGSRVINRSVTSTTATSEVDVEESIALNAGMWGGFGVDEDDDMLGSRHFRAGPSQTRGAGGGGEGDVNSGSDGDIGVVDTLSPDPRRGPSGAGVFAANAWAGARGLPPVGAGGPSPPVTAAGGARGGAWAAGSHGGEDLPSPPPHRNLPYNAGAVGPMSPPIRRSTARVEISSSRQPDRGYDREDDDEYDMTSRGATGTTRNASMAGFFGVGSGVGAGSGGNMQRDSDGGDSLFNNLDRLLDEEALLAGYGHDLGRYDDWVRPLDPRGPSAPAGGSNHPAQRAFTPPIVPASRALGVAGANAGSGGAIAAATAAATAGGPRKSTSMVAGAGAGGEAGAGAGSGAQVLRVGGGGVVAAAGGEAMLDLVYDPVLNCYYDSTTGQYYELKT
ncbi:hypothetical protein Agub_g10966 [Astrephomene gubernaculifera]|uniref:CFA20 domain-containing protein n=1 Tax=Astrephomene gubernaculifera TaxID=47775 RepID=A0AAD3HQC5_9CHLO|nr:hypothetical protein Agub_g10966 [Astrephomene gubernaculifera]